MKKFNKRGASQAGLFIVIGVLLVGAYLLNVGNVQSFLKGTSATPPAQLTTCPSSGLTTVTLNAQEALASSATNAQVDYYVFEKDGTFVKSGATASGTVSFDLQCGNDKKYDMIVLNETARTGYYSQAVEIDATKATFPTNLKMYEYGEIDLVSVASDVDPLGYGNISAGNGKSCGFVITLTENESVSAFNKPIVMCQTNTSAVDYVTMSGSGAVEAMSKIPSRKSVSLAGYEWTAYELPRLYLSTEGATKISGKVKFLDSGATPLAGTTDSMNCTVVDQATFHKAEYQTMKLNEGFVEAAENTQTKADVGAPDSTLAATSEVLYFQHANGYC